MRARCGPKRQQESEASCLKSVAAIQAQLDQVANLDEDRIIRRYLNLILVTLRTNFFQPALYGAGDGGEKAYCSFKFDSRAIEELPQPQPLREIFVYSPAMEGIHLRSEEHTSELQSLMRISYAVFCLKKQKNNDYNKT